MNDFTKLLKEERLTKVIQLLDKIKYKQKLIDEKNKAIDNLNYEKDLITDDIVNNIKTLADSDFALIYGLNCEYYRKAWLYYHDKNKTTFKDKEERKKAKYLFEWITNTIKKEILLDNPDFKLKDILMIGYNNGYGYYYTYKDKEFEIQIPMWSTTNKDNYEVMLKGFRIFVKESEYCWKEILYNINYRELAKDFKDWIENL